MKQCISPSAKMLVGLLVFCMQIHGQNVHGNNIFLLVMKNSDIIYIVDVVYMGMAAESLRRSIHQEGILWKS